jgi:hypothetical protein
VQSGGQEQATQYSLSFDPQCISGESLGMVQALRRLRGIGQQLALDRGPLSAAVHFYGGGEEFREMEVVVQGGGIPGSDSAVGAAR